MPNNFDFTQILVFLQPTHVLKWILLVILGFYLIFLFVIYDQIRSMEKVITQPLSTALLGLFMLILTTISIWLFIFVLFIHIV